MLKSSSCLLLALVGLGGCVTVPPPAATLYNVRDYGATGDGQSLDTEAINRTIAAAAAAGGGTVYFPAGTYASYSIHLQSNIALYLAAGSTILAADPPAAGTPGGYDAPEPNPGNDRYEDFGHSHWHNSLIWGDGLVNVAILGPGRIFGRGLSRGFGRKDLLPGEPRPPRPAFTRPAGPVADPGYPNPRDTLPAGVGNKSIALKNCRNVILRDFTIYHGGHFGILATGTDNFTIDNLKIDTNRDGMDIDCCQEVRISNCTVNSPADDGICLKSSYGLGYARPCKNLTITGCQVSGFLEGTLLDGTRKVGQRGGTGRIKFGTEGNGGFQNIAISNCVFDSCLGLALETVDGALLEDIAVSNLTMRNIVDAPIFLRLGARLRGPAETTKVGALRRVSISNIVAHNVEYRSGILIVGLPGISDRGPQPEPHHDRLPGRRHGGRRRPRGAGGGKDVSGAGPLRRDSVLRHVCAPRAGPHGRPPGAELRRNANCGRPSSSTTWRRPISTTSRRRTTRRPPRWCSSRSTALSCATAPGCPTPAATRPVTDEKL